MKILDDEDRAYTRSRNAFVEQGMRQAEYEMYRSNVGEIEAREAAARQHMTPAMREQRPPFGEETTAAYPPEKAWFMPDPALKRKIKALKETDPEAALKLIVKTAIQEHWEQGDTVRLVVKRDQAGNIRTDKDGKPMYEEVPWNIKGSAPVREIFQRLKNSDQAYDEAGNLIADRLEVFARELMKDPRMREAIGWYTGMTKRIQDKLGANMDFFGQLLAATSPNTYVVQNFEYALDAMKGFAEGRFDKVLEKFNDYVNKGREKFGDDAEGLRKYVNKWPRSKLPLKANGKKFGFNGPHVLKVLTGIWEEFNKGAKTGTFGPNITGKSDQATIDIWAIRTLHRLLNEQEGTRWRLNNFQEGGVTGNFKTGDYRLAQTAFRNAAERMGMKPHDLQALLWFGEKQYRNDKGWSRGKAAKDLSDFRSLFGEYLGDTRRYQAGVSTFRTGEPFSEEIFEATRKTIEDTLRGTPGMVAFRVTPSEGMYLGQVEPSYDMEFSTTADAKVAHIEELLQDIGRGRMGPNTSQADVFLSRVLDYDETHENARPILEIGFKEPKAPGPETTAEMEALAELFKENDLSGFSVAKDAKGNIMGIRSQAVPEFIPGLAPDQWNDFFNEWHDNAERVRDSFDPETLAYGEIRQVDTRIWTRGTHYDETPGPTAALPGGGLTPETARRPEGPLGGPEGPAEIPGRGLAQPSGVLRGRRQYQEGVGEEARPGQTARPTPVLRGRAAEPEPGIAEPEGIAELGQPTRPRARRRPPAAGNVPGEAPTPAFLPGRAAERPGIRSPEFERAAFWPSFPAARAALAPRPEEEEEEPLPIAPVAPPPARTQAFQPPPTAEAEPEVRRAEALEPAEPAFQPPPVVSAPKTPPKKTSRRIRNSQGAELIELGPPKEGTRYASGRVTVFGHMQDGSLDTQDNQIGFYRSPETGIAYDTGDNRLAIASLPENVVADAIGDPDDPEVAEAISRGDWRVELVGPSGKRVVAQIGDSGPAEWTGVGIDVTGRLANLIGIKGNSGQIRYRIIRMPAKRAQEPAQARR
jgi:hypothetical protein